MPATTKESCHWTITSFVISINSSHTYKFTLDANSGPWYGCACYLEETSPTPPAAPGLTLVLSIAWSLFTQNTRVGGVPQLGPCPSGRRASVPTPTRSGGENPDLSPLAKDCKNAETSNL